MKNTYAITAIVSIALLTGCTSAQINYVPQSQVFEEPNIGKVVTVPLGEHLLRQGRITKHEAIKLSNTVTIAGYPIVSGTLRKSGDTRDYEDYLPMMPGMITKPWYKDTPLALRVYKDNTQACVVTIYAYAVCETGDFTYLPRVTIPTVQNDTYVQTLIYSGKVGNRIRVAYREFTNDMARASYSNDAEYDLSESRIIGYKSAQLEVIEANNQQIKYRVLRHFK